jgi:predicted unusual protein kinase regulating ubiquinone biosynthesis (AarF/ABC1/UbiB family)
MADDEHILKGRLGRLTRIAGMATQVGADLAKAKIIKWAGGTGAGEEAAARRVLETLGSLKGVALKAGQTLSMFAGGLPPEARAIVGKLFSQAPPVPYEQIAQALKEELGRSPQELFARFDEQPFAAASLGQVHAATLHSGEDVAVKVQYPGVGDALDSDLKNLESITKAMGWVFDTSAYASEMRRELSAELDYVRERHQLEEFRGLVSQWPDLVVPRTYPELCTGRVLVLERFHGPTLADVAQNLDAYSHEQRWKIGLQLGRAVFGPMVRNGIVHADAHPGNYVVLSDGRFGVLDFGSIKRLSERLWNMARTSLTAEMTRAPTDWLAVLRAGGMEIPAADEKLRPIIVDILDIVHTPLRGEYDFGADKTLERLSALKMKFPLELLKVRPPPEGLLVARALAGVLQNLKALKVRGDVRPLLHELLDLPAEA